MFRQKIGVCEGIDDIFGEPVVRQAHLRLHGHNLPLQDQRFLPVSNPAGLIFDSVSSRHHFGQATKYGHLTKFCGGRLPEVLRCDDAAAGASIVGALADRALKLTKSSRPTRKSS
jgi:hypothetical protein